MNSYQGVPIPVLILLAVALLGAFHYEFYDLWPVFYAIGGNADAARLSGIDNKRTILKVYALLGALNRRFRPYFHGPRGQCVARCGNA